MTRDPEAQTSPRAKRAARRGAWALGACASGLAGALALGSLASAQDEPVAQDRPVATRNEAAAPPCATPRFRAQLMTSVAGTIPRDAALLVGLFPGGDLTEPAPVALQRGRRGVTMRRETIAPGLFRLTPEARRIYGRYTVTGVAATPSLQFSRPGLPAAPTQPSLERVERYLVASDGASRTELRAHFAFPIPEGVAAVVSYWGDDATPDLSTRAVPTRNEVVLWASTGRCSQLPAGASPPPTEGTVRVAFVDQYGQLSQPSNPQPLTR